MPGQAPTGHPPHCTGPPLPCSDRQHQPFTARACNRLWRAQRQRNPPHLGRRGRGREPGEGGGGWGRRGRVEGSRACLGGKGGRGKGRGRTGRSARHQGTETKLTARRGSARARDLPPLPLHPTYSRPSPFLLCLFRSAFLSSSSFSPYPPSNQLTNAPQLQRR